MWSCQVLISTSLLVFSCPMCLIDLTGANPTSSVPIPLQNFAKSDTSQLCAIFLSLLLIGCDSNTFVQCMINQQTKSVVKACQKIKQRIQGNINGMKMWTGMVILIAHLLRSYILFYTTNQYNQHPFCVSDYKRTWGNSLPPKQTLTKAF